MKVNGKEYPMWSQFVERAGEFIGNTMEERDGNDMATTTITGITLKPNGNESAYFMVSGKDFACGFDVGYGGISAGDEGWITFAGTYGLNFRIQTN